MAQTAARLRSTGILALVFVGLGLVAAWASAMPTAIALTNCSADTSIDSEESEFLQLINNYRDENGLDPLVLSDSLNRSAAWKANDMAVDDYFAHDDQSPDRTWSRRIRDCGYTANTYIGENLAAGNEAAQATFDQWRNSPGHNANMLNEHYIAIGIGRAQDSDSTYGWYWATDFGGVADAAPPPGSDPEHNGDVDCDGETDTIDGALVLQFSAALIGSLRCQSRADVNQDGRIGATDSAIILQYSAGLVRSLPV